MERKQELLDLYKTMCKSEWNQDLAEKQVLQPTKPAVEPFLIANGWGTASQCRCLAPTCLSLRHNNLPCFWCEDPLSAVYSVRSIYMFITEPYLQKAQGKSQTPVMWGDGLLGIRAGCSGWKQQHTLNSPESRNHSQSPKHMDWTFFRRCTPNCKGS